MVLKKQVVELYYSILFFKENHLIYKTIYKHVHIHISKHEKSPEHST